MHKHTYLCHSYMHMCSFRHTDMHTLTHSQACTFENRHIHAYVCTPTHSDISFCTHTHPHTSTLNAFTRTLIYTFTYTQSPMQIHIHHSHSQSQMHSCSNNPSTYINSYHSHITHTHMHIIYTHMHTPHSHTHISIHTLVHMYTSHFLHRS